MGAPSVIEALRGFLPAHLATRPVMSPGQWRAVDAILHCRTPAMGGQVFGCPDCGGQHFAWHSCNHKACPQCGGDATAKWVERQMARRVEAPHFLVTFTLPEALREMFLGALAKDAYGIFFRAVSDALETTLASPKSMGAATIGFTSILHTWNQRLLFHPHIHCIVPGAGLDAQGALVKTRNPQYLAPLPILRSSFRRAFRRGMEAAQWQTDPAVWRVDWGVHIRPCGDGGAAIKYLGAYVAKPAIRDSRMVAMNDKTVTFRWKDRSQGDALKVMTLNGVEFVKRYLGHVLLPGMRSIRYHGYHHPSAKKNRERVRFLAGGMLVVGRTAPPAQAPARPGWLCACCGKTMALLDRITRPDRMSHLRTRAPPKPCAA